MVWFLVGCVGVQSVPTAVVIDGEVEIVLTFQGELEAEKSVALVTPKVDHQPEISFLAEHGGRVEEGEVVVRFDTEEPEKRLRELHAERAVTQTRIASQLAKLGTQKESAERQVRIAELDAEMAALRQTDSETVARVDREQGRVAVEKARISMMLAENQRSRTVLDSTTEVHLLRLELDDLNADITRYEQRIEKATLFAPSPGLVLHEEQRWNRGRVKVGTELWPGSTVLRIPDMSSLRVRAWTHEVHAPRVRLGQIARIVLDAVPDQPTAGEVTRIADLAKPRGDAGIKHVEVLLGLDDTAEAMKPGMSVEVQLRVAKHNTSNVPLEAVFYDEEGAFVWLSGLAGFAHHAITIIDKNKEVAVVSGVEEGSVVATFDPEAWAAGQRPVE